MRWAGKSVPSTLRVMSHSVLLFLRAFMAFKMDLACELVMMSLGAMTTGGGVEWQNLRHCRMMISVGHKQSVTNTADPKYTQNPNLKMILCLRFKFRFPLTSIVFFAHMMKIDGIKTVWLPDNLQNIHLCSTEEKRSFGFLMTWRRVNGTIVLFWWTIPLISDHICPYLFCIVA